MMSNYNELKTTFALILFFLVTQQLSGQSTVKVLILPATAIIEVDGVLVKYGEEIHLKPGDHVVKAKAIGYLPSSGIFILKKDEKKTYKLRLVATDEYAAHIAKTRRYKSSKSLLKVAPIATYTGLSFLLFLKRQDLIKKSDDNLKLANEAEQRYNNSFWKDDIENARGEFITHKSDYQANIETINKTSRKFVLLTGTAAAVTWLTWKLASRIEKPVFQENASTSSLRITPVIMTSSKGFLLTYNF